MTVGKFVTMAEIEIENVRLQAQLDALVETCVEQQTQIRKLLALVEELEESVKRLRR